MNTNMRRARILGPQDGEYAGKVGVLHDWFLINAQDTSGRFAVEVFIRSAVNIKRTWAEIVSQPGPGSNIY
jgi:hypothetical protein